MLERHHDLLVLGRRSSGARNERLRPMEQWPASLEGEVIDVAVSTLGTTRKAAGSWAAFEAVDRHALLGFAEAARKAGARQFILVSSSGADAGSRIAYLRLKGEVEEAVVTLGFERVDLLRPGLLLGERREHRAGEALGQRLMPLIAPLLIGKLKRVAGIPAIQVARAAATLVGVPQPGRFVHFNPEIAALAEGA